MPAQALGSDPLAASSTVLPTYTRIGNIVRYTVPKRPTNDALLTPETSPNLQSWNPTDPTIQITETPTSYTFEAPLPTSGKLFLRLRATLP